MFVWLNWLKFQKFASNKIRFSINFENFENARTFYVLFYNVYKEKQFTVEKEDGPSGLNLGHPYYLRRLLLRVERGRGVKGTFTN